jgi:hypothetical protein
MWTICWKDDEQRDRWDRFESRKDVIDLINTLIREVDVCEDDILIFPPEADDLTIPYDEIENE